MTSVSEPLSRSGVVPGSGVEKTFFAHAFPASEIGILAFTADPSTMFVQWSSDRINIDFQDVVTLSGGLGVSARFPTRAEFVALCFTGAAPGSVVRYQTSFRSPGSSVSVLASLGTGAEVLKTEVPGIRSIISSDGSITVTELAEEIDLTGAGTPVTLTSVGGGESLVADGVGPDLEVKSLSAGTGISLVSGAEVVTIEATTPSPYQESAGLITPISASVAAVVAGTLNTISAASVEGFVGGGSGNSLVGTAPQSGIVSGTGNTITSCVNSVICGGSANEIDPGTGSAANGLCSGIGNSITRLVGGSAVQANFIGGGSLNNIDNGSANTVVGGTGNIVEGGGIPVNSHIAAGLDNILRSGGQSAIVAGTENIIDAANNSRTNALCCGAENTITRLTGGTIVEANFIAGGGLNNIDNAKSSSIVGGTANTIEGGGISLNSLIAAGADHLLRSGDQTVIVGGSLNSVDAGNNSRNNALCCGSGNSITRLVGTPVVQRNFIAGGELNNIDGASSCVVLGGSANAIQAPGICQSCGILGGEDNTIENTRRSAIIGGRGNTISLSNNSGDNAIIGGDSHSMLTGGGGFLGRNVILSGSNSTITAARDNALFGSDIAATHNGNFLFSDSAGGTALASAGNHRFDVRCSGGATFYSNTANTLGVSLASGGAAWAAVSDRNMKDLQGLLDPRSALEKVRTLPIYQYNYKGQDPAFRYIGPTAQDWHARFGSGKNPLKIDTIDPVGVALASIQALDTAVRALEAHLHS